VASAGQGVRCLSLSENESSAVPYVLNAIGNDVDYICTDANNRLWALSRSGLPSLWLLNKSKNMFEPSGRQKGVTIRNAKFEIEDAVIGPDYQYATSNEVLPGKTAEITVEDGRLLLIKIN
jgi:thiamine pyrophosphokinase